MLILEQAVLSKDLIINLNPLINLTVEDLNWILNETKKHSHIGHIIFNEQTRNQRHLNDYIKKIENQLIINNRKFKAYTSDYTLCLLAKNTVYFDYLFPIYDYITEENFHYAKNDWNFQIKDTADWKEIEEEHWEIHNFTKAIDYLSILRINHVKKQLVLSFQGIKFDVNNSFS